MHNLGEELLEFLNVVATQISVVKSPFHAFSFDQAYKVVELVYIPISELPEQLAIDYFYNRTKLALSVKAPQSTPTIEKLLPIGYDLKPRKKVNNVFGVLGSHGAGKTTIATNIVKTKLDENKASDYQNASSYVFFLQCRHINYDTTVNIIQLLATSLPHCWILDKKKCDDVLKNLDESKKIFIIIDDLDFAKKHFKSNTFHSLKTLSSLHDKSTAEIFIKNMLSGDIFPKASILVTCRPHTFHQLDKELEKSFAAVEILGLSSDAQNQLCQQICHENSSKVIDFIRCHPFLNTFCFNPEYCAMVMHVANLFSSKNDFFYTVPVTRVVIAAYFMLLHSKNLQLPEHAVKELAASAWRQIEKKELKNFEDGDLPENCFYESIAPLFNTYTVQKEKIVKPVRHFYFLWLEIFAAFEWIFNKDTNDYENFLDQAVEKRDDPLWYVAMHIGGMCDRPTLQYIRRLFFSKYFTVQMNQVQNCLKNFVKEKTLSKSFLLSLFVCSLVYSMQDQSLADLCAFRLGNTMHVNGNLDSNDITGLYYVLRARKKDLFLDVDITAVFLENSLLRFIQALLDLPKVKVAV